MVLCWKLSAKIESAFLNPSTVSPDQTAILELETEWKILVQKHKNNRLSPVYTKIGFVLTIRKEHILYPQIAALYKVTHQGLILDCHYISWHV